MKKILLLSALALTGGSLFAQNKMTGADGRIGIKAGVNLAQIHLTGDGSKAIQDDTKNNLGYNFTVFGDFGVGNNFFIQPGISLQNKGTKVDDGSIKYTRNVMAIEVPINAVLRIPTGDAGAVQINAGPYIGFNVSGKDKTEVSGAASTEKDLSFGNKTSNDQTSTDFGANMGVAYRMNNGFLIGANYGLGLSNLIPKDSRTNNNLKATNRVIGLSVGYSF